MLNLPVIKKGVTLYDVEKVLSEIEQIDLPVAHHFADGIYVRELVIPKGTIIIGKRHRKETCNILLKGSISIFLDDDGKIVGENGRPIVKRFYAPAIFNSPPFSKKMGYTHEDTIFLNIHPTQDKDLDKIEQEFIIPETEYLEFISMVELKEQ